MPYWQLLWVQILNHPLGKKLFCLMCTQGICRRLLNVESWWLCLESSFGLCQYGNKGQMSFFCHQGNGLVMVVLWNPHESKSRGSGVKTISTTCVWHKTCAILTKNTRTFVIFYHHLLEHLDCLVMLVMFSCSLSKLGIICESSWAIVNNFTNL